MSALGRKGEEETLKTHDKAYSDIMVPVQEQADGQLEQDDKWLRDRAMSVGAWSHRQVGGRLDCIPDGKIGLVY